MGRYFPNRDECLQGLTCSTCHRHTSYYRRENEGVNLCKGCFKDSVERKVRRTISRWKMFSPADHIAVAVSGGKDSLTMLMILKKLSAKFKQPYLCTLFQGGVERFARFNPVLRDPRGGFLPRVKPLCEVPEKEVALYGYAEGLTFQSASCPYMTEALRNELRTMLNRLELAHQGVLFSSYRAITKLRALAEPGVPDSVLLSCRSCGEPTTMEICEACKMVGATVDKLEVAA